MIEKVLEALLRPVQAQTVHKQHAQVLNKRHCQYPPQGIIASWDAPWCLSLFTLNLCSSSCMEELLIQNRCLCVCVCMCV